MAETDYSKLSYDDIAKVLIKNSDGTSYTIPYSVAKESGLVSNQEDFVSAKNRTGYRTNDGGYTTDYSKAGFRTGISLNKDTGNVQIDAPKMLFSTQSYQEKIKPVLETISQNYKLNPEYKYALLNGDEDTKTSEDWVKEIEKELPEWVSATLSNQKVKDQVKQDTGLDLSDEQLIKMSSVALERQADGSIIQVKDDTIQSLPEVIKNLPAFKNLQGWQNGEVTYKDLMESWNRENTSDEDILKVYDTVSDYFKKGEFTDADEYAEMVAFSQFISEKHPETGFWRGVGDWVSDLFYNAWAGTAKFDVGVLNTLEGVANFAGTAGSSLAAGEWTGKPATGELNFVRDYLAPELENQMDEFQTNSMRLNEAAGSVGAIVYELTPLAMQIAVGAALGRAAANGVSSAATKMIAKTGEAGLIGAAEGMTAEQVAVNALNGTNFLMRTMSANKANGIVAAAVGTLKAAQTYTAIVATTADLAAQIVVDVTVQDSKLARQLIDGNVSNEVKEYVLEQIALDAGGWAVAVGSIKAVKGLGKTDVGKVVNAAAVPRINKWSAKIGEYTDNLKTAFHKGDANWNKTRADRLRAELDAEMPEGWKRTRKENKIGAAERRQQNLQIRRIERLARTKVGELSGITKGASSWTEIVQNANEIKKESDTYFTAAHALADRVYKADVSARVTRIKTDVPSLSEALDQYTSQLKRVLRAEDAARLKRGTKAIDVGEGRVISMISKESNEYVLGTYRASLGESAESARIKEGLPTKGVRQEIEYYTEATQKFRDEYPELAAELDKLRELAKKVSAATEDARVFEGVLTEEELLGRRNSEYFENGYIRTQRAKDWENYQKRGGELSINKIRDDEHLKWGFDGDAPREYQDITFVLFDDVNQVAKQSIRRDEIGYLKELGETVEVRVTGDEVRRAKTINPIKTKVKKSIQNNTDKVVKNMGDSAFAKVFNFKGAKSEIATAEAKTIEKGANVSKAKVKAPRVTLRDRQDLVKDLDRYNLDDLVVLDQTSPFAKAVETEEDFQEFLDGLGNKTRKWVIDSIDRQVDYLYPKAFSREEELAKLPTYNEKSWLKATGKKEISAWAKKYVTSKGGEKVDDLSKIEKLKKSIAKIKNTPEESQYTLDNFQKLIDNDPDILTNLKRQYVLNNDKILKDDKVTEVISKLKQEQAVFDAETLYAKNIRDLQDIKDKYDITGMKVDLNEEMDDLIDGFIDNNRKNPQTLKALEALDDSGDIVEYATLKSLTDERNLKSTKDKIESAAAKKYNQYLTDTNTVKDGDKTVKKMTGDQIKKVSSQWAKQTADWYEERVNQRFSVVANRLRKEGNDIVDYDDLFGRIEEINKEITGVKKSDDIVKTYDDIGSEEYVRLSPTVANLITTMPTPIRRGMFGEIQAEFVKVFRMGTTGGLVPQSLIRQWFRDSGLAVTTGDMTRGMSEIEDQLTKVYGPTVAEYYQQNVPDLWDTLLRRSEETGEDINRLAAQQEMARAKTYAPDQLQSNLYRFRQQTRVARNQDGIYEQSTINGIRDKLERAFMKTEKLNNMRETNRRIWVYNNAYIEALNNGHTVPMARRYAEMIQAEATTNFSRQAYHLANLSKTVPYLGSAINGSKSFWRLMAIDPAGITTRIVGGYLVPLIALTNLSLSDPENREVYKSIPEYEKDDNLVFVVSGQKFTIPIPQEVSSLLRPIQSWIETMQGANDHSLDELTANNLAGFFPYELQGFVNIDSDRILMDNAPENFAVNHLLPGFSMLSSQMMAPLVKSGVMWATGYDPYTRKRINTAYSTTDALTGETTVIDYKSGELAKALGNIFKGNLNISAEMAQAIFNNILGTGNMNIIDSLSEIAAAVPTEEGIGAGLTSAAEKMADAALKPLMIPDYGERVNQAWRRAVNQLYAEKNAILNDPEYNADLKALSDEDLTTEAQNKILARINTKKQEFQEKVLNATKNLMNNYSGGTLDRYKFASVISLMAFSNGYSQDPTSPLAKEQSSESYKLAKARAIETMAQMGFDSPNDNSIFGYYNRNPKTGEIAVEFYSPLAILDFEKSNELQSDIALANIKAIVNDLGLWKAHESVEEQRDKIYAKNKLTKQDYANIDAIYINWNAQVASALAPYVDKMTPEAAINNSAVRDYLYPLIEVPGEWEVNNKNRHISLGDRGNKKKAYYDSWVKSLFGVNDKYKGQY